MKPKSIISTTTASKNLHQLVDMAAGYSIPKAVKRNSFIVNEVPREFQIASDEIIVSAILNNLLSSVVSHSKHSCIRIKANLYDDIVCLSIKDNSNFSNYADNENLAQVKQLVQKLKGSVIVRNMEDKFTTILLSFPNYPIAV